MASLQAILHENVRKGELHEKLDRNRVRCFACGHCCPIPDGHAGVCKVRYNRGGTLYVPWGYVGVVQCDPIEKKPFFHAYPGALAYSFGMLGCDLHCSYCQNWVTSQALRDPAAASPPLRATPEGLVREALRLGARVVVSTYNEPLITSEWAVAVFKEARAAGLLTAFVSNGNGTPQVLEYLRPWADLYKVDLKSFDDRHYRQLGGRLQPILDTIQRLHQLGFWMEIVTLVIPGFNDSDDELQRLAEGVIGPSQWEAEVHFRQTQGPDSYWFVRNFRERFGQVPDYTAAGGFAVGLVLAQCIRQAGSLEDEHLREVAAELDFTTFYGRFRIDPRTGRQIGHQILLTQWQQGRKVVLG